MSSPREVFILPSDPANESLARQLVEEQEGALGLLLVTEPLPDMYARFQPYEVDTASEEVHAEVDEYLHQVVRPRIRNRKPIVIVNGASQPADCGVMERGVGYLGQCLLGELPYARAGIALKPIALLYRPRWVPAGDDPIPERFAEQLELARRFQVRRIWAESCRLCVR